MNESALKSLTDLRDFVLQRARIAFRNRVDAIERGDDTADEDTVRVLTDWGDLFEELEKKASRDIADLVGDVPIVEAMTELKGIGKILAAKLISSIDINKANTVSALWRYAGYAVIDGARERPTKGQRLHYNANLHRNMYLVAQSFLRSSSPYRRVYDDARAYYDTARPEWTDGHKHMASMRKMNKIFLAHLWEHWRELEGLPAEKAYVFEKMGHTHEYNRFDFGWKRDGNG